MSCGAWWRLSLGFAGRDEFLGSVKVREPRSQNPEKIQGATDTFAVVLRCRAIPSHGVDRRQGCRPTLWRYDASAEIRAQTQPEPEPGDVVPVNEVTSA